MLFVARVVKVLSNTCIDTVLPVIYVVCCQGRQGVIKHLYRHFAFIHSRMMTENGGIFVCRTRHLVLAGASKVSMASGHVTS